MTKIFDTSSLLLISDELFETKNEDIIVITSITLKELEKIKTSTNKDANVKYAARQLLRKLDTYPQSYICYIYKPYMNKWIEDKDLELNDDAKILAASFDYIYNQNITDYIFYTNDLALKKIASLFFKEKINSININNDNYTGYKNIYFDEEEMANFYSNQNEYGKILQLYFNEYINIYNKNTYELVDTLCWTNTGFRPLKYKKFFSNLLGEIKPFKDDILQAIACDSLINNKITMLKGKPGSGKSTLALGYLFYALEKNKIDKIIIFCNPIATKNAAKLGYYPGDRITKLLDSQIGNFLSSKLGDRIAIEQLLDKEQLILLPVSDIRGYDTSGMNAGIYVTEAQNLDIELLKLILQRIGEDSIAIIDGDVKSQVDLIDYEGANNGMKKMSKIFRGENIYGEIELNQIHRSRIAEIAERL